ncbi:GNAT family N-acetyltransferase [Rhodococcus hoagii]|nr:GNAT family N-acetyltransferase [Prescottella equi]MBM4654106.1 GNAT family N-acetyltransferase [Prescottella equi]MBM4719580.1 GNAT family N-acetyltransferase [Prescottella equi]NKR23379.1 GNAT family N-acetyltransferase [Prescottella equi]NKT56010.1 GNAT family N-acetyltransferase [Prescottella equi]
MGNVRNILPGRDFGNAVELWSSGIAGLNPSNIGPPYAARQPHVAPWTANALEVHAGIDVGGRLAAAIHAGPTLEYVAALLPQVEARVITDQGVAEIMTRCIQIQELAVHPDHRGQGHGAALIAEVEDRARHAGVFSLNGFVDLRNDSTGFYRRLGYTVLAPNTPIPPDVLLGLPTVHVPLWDGNWFYKVLG